MAQKNYVVDLNLGGNILKNVRVDVVANDPGTPAAGQAWYNSTSNTLKYYDGTAVRPVAVEGQLTTSSFGSGVLTTDLAASATGSQLATAAAVKSYADGIIAAADAMLYKGVVDASTDPNYPAGNAGEVWKISVAGHIGGASGPVVQIGDMIICTADATATGDHATVGASWNIIQTNIDGAVTGPVSATDNALARFDSTTGKLIQNSAVTVDDSGVFTGGDATGIVSAASETLAGKVELATVAEAQAGTDTARAVTPAGLAAVVASQTKKYTAEITASTGATITAATHGLGAGAAKAVHVYDGTGEVVVQVDIATNGDVTWASNSAITGTLVIFG